MSNRNKFYQESESWWMFQCPGCESLHSVDARWTFNGDLESPTVSPSILVRGGEKDFNCHSFIRDGKIEFLSDSTHSLAGQTIEIPLWND